jgi:hypothetical protein
LARRQVEKQSTSTVHNFGKIVRKAWLISQQSHFAGRQTSDELHASIIAFPKLVGTCTEAAFTVCHLAYIANMRKISTSRLFRGLVFLLLIMAPENPQN